jgi:hypothetical protein
VPKATGTTMRGVRATRRRVGLHGTLAIRVQLPFTT